MSLRLSCPPVLSALGKNNLADCFSFFSFFVYYSLEEKDVFEGDIEALIAPYATANLWWWPHKRKFHQRYYDVVDINSTTQQAFQNTFSVTKLEAEAIKAIFNSGKIAFTSNMM